MQWALSENSPIEILGHGSKRGIGRPWCEHALDLSALSGVTLYRTEELVPERGRHTDRRHRTAAGAKRPGARLRAYGLRAIARRCAECGTIGGALAANVSGPRRIKAGAAGDHILGINAVSGRGEAFKSGGRLVKNVTGYDMSKLMAGSWGTLAVLTDVTFKVLPAAETGTTLVLRGLFDDAAVAAMALAMGSPAEVSGAAHLPESVSARIDEALAGSSATLLRIEGFGPSVEYRVDHLKTLFGAADSIDTIAGDLSKAIWRAVRDCIPFADGTERPVWRISMAPSETHKMVMALRMQTAVDAFYDWAGGLVWLRMESDPEANLLRGLIRRFGGGHATLVRAVQPIAPPFRYSSAGARACQPVGQAERPVYPNGILNPGRMAGARTSAKVVA